MPIAEIAGGLTALNALKDIAKTVADLRDAAAFNEKRVELQSKIIEAQTGAMLAHEERSKLIQRVGFLEEEIARLKAWDSEKKRYELKRWGHGAFVRILKEDCKDGEPVHALCVNCYERGEKSFLHSNGKHVTLEHLWICPVCKSSINAPRNALVADA